MTIASYLEKRCLSALYSAGIDVNERRWELQRECRCYDLTDFSDSALRNAAMTILSSLGYEITSNDHLAFLGIQAPASDGKYPIAGDCVRLTGPWAGQPIGSVGILQGFRSTSTTGYTIAFGSAFDDGQLISVSGGPASFLKLSVSALKTTHEVVISRRWRFRFDRPAAHDDVPYLRQVRMWEWNGVEADAFAQPEILPEDAA